MPTIDPRRYAAAMRVCAGYLTEELEDMPYRALQLRFEREALYAEMTAQLDARAKQAERERDEAIRIIGILRDRYHCKCANPFEDLADTDEAAEQVFKAGQMRDIEVYDILVAFLAARAPEGDTPHGAP